MRQRWDIALVMLLGGCFFMAAAGSVRGEWTTATEPNSIAPAGTPDAETITFSEYSENTYITTQYGYRGIVFGGDAPFITSEGNFEPEPYHTLSGSPLYTGAIEGWFVDPGDPNIPTTVNGFSLDAGYFDEIGTTRLTWFDSAGRKLGEQFNSKTGFEKFIIHDIGIAHWRIAMVTNDTQGYVIDNVKIEIPLTILLSKREDTDGQCQDLWSEYNYTITYLYPDDPNHTRQPLTGITLVDYLPREVDYMPPSSPDGSYDIINHKIIWNLGTIYPGIPGTVTLTVMVNEQSEPNGILINEAELLDAEGNVLWTAVCETKVCCWGGDVIYVDDRATGYNNGTSWANAYTDLQAAIARAKKGCGTQIWVAKGTYYPGDDPTMSFEIPDNISVYGGFAGTETAIDKRDIKANPTILSGYIRTVNGIEERNRAIVTMGDGGLLDGVIVEMGQLYGIYGDNVDFVLQNCHICNNVDYGLWCQNGNAEVTFTSLYNNGADGIYHYGNNFTLLITNCSIEDNKQNGINCRYSIPIIINSVVHRNGSDSNTNSLYYGVRLFQPSSRPVLRNNTIVCNTSAGIYYVNNSYGTLPKPQVKNSIVWHNAEDEGFVDIQGLNDIVHSCLTDPNNVYGINTQTDAKGNLRSNPVFAYSNLSLDNFHLAYNSPCKDMGDPNETATTEVDMDNQARIAGNSVEMGADEVDCEDVYNPLDWDADGLVNLKEFEAFSAAWLTYDPNNPNLPNPIDPNAILHWNPMCDLDSDLDVDMGDLMLFIPDWCWAACWRVDMLTMQQPVSAMMTQSGPIVSESLSISSTDARYMKVESAELIDTDLTLALSLINQIHSLIETNQENADAWQEMIYLLEQSLLETENTRIKTAEF